MLRMAQTGRAFTSSRLHAAGLAPDNSCIACGEKETVRPLFCDCPAHSRTRPAPVESGHDVPMLTGVVFSPPLQLEPRCLKCPGPFIPTDIVFIDGSCYKSNWHLLQHIFFPRNAILRASSPHKIARARGRKFLRQPWLCHIPEVLSPLLVIVWRLFESSEGFKMLISRANETIGIAGIWFALLWNPVLMECTS